MGRSVARRVLWLCAWLLVACAPAPLPDMPRETANVATPGVQATVRAPAVLRATYPVISALDVSALRAGGELPLGIRYTLDAPALVRLRLVDNDSPGVVLRVLLDWAPRERGEQVESWDGLDAHGDPVSPRSVTVALVAEPALDGGATAMWDRGALLALRYPEHKHFTHDPALCADLDVALTAPLGGATLRGVVDVCAALGERRGMPDGVYHVVLYLDGRTAWDGRLPEGAFCQAWDTRNVPDGTYRLAVTFNDLHDHSGSDWVSVTVSNAE
jgi:hypothetical protein